MFGMLIQSLSGGANGFYGYGAGLGAAALVKGTDFNCNADICYAIGAANDKTFKLLQQTINTLAKLGGYAPLVVDGFIGDKTVKALQALSKLGLQSPPTTKEQAAASAADLVTKLSGIATSQAAQGQTLAPPLNPVQLPDSAVAAKLPILKSKTLWWVLGGLATVATVGGVGYVVYRRRRRA